MPQARQAHMSFRDVFPVARSKFGTLLPYGKNYQRVDVIGMVMALEEPPLRTGNKTLLWLKDQPLGYHIGGGSEKCAARRMWSKWTT